MSPRSDAGTTWTITFTSGDLDAFEFAVADYVAKWGEHLTGVPYMGEFGPNLAGMPVAVGNMAGTVLRKWVTKRWTFASVPVPPVEAQPS